MSFLGYNCLGEMVYESDLSHSRYLIRNGIKIPYNNSHAFHYLIHDSSAESLSMIASAYYLFNRKKYTIKEYLDSVVGNFKITPANYGFFAIALNHKIISNIENIYPTNNEIDFCKEFILSDFIDYELIKNHILNFFDSELNETNYGYYSFFNKSILLTGRNYNDHLGITCFINKCKEEVLDCAFLYYKSIDSFDVDVIKNYRKILIVVNGFVDCLISFDGITVENINGYTVIKKNPDLIYKKESINGLVEYSASWPESFKKDIPSIRNNIYKHIYKQGYDNFHSFLKDKLKYETIEEISNIYSIEQIDAIVQSIWKFELNESLIVADETGIGKGRTLAGIMRYGYINEKNIIFITENSGLFTDIYRDIIKTLSYGFFINPIVINQDASIYRYDNLDLIYKPSDKKRNEKLSGAKLILATYSQFNKKNTSRIKEIEKYLDNSIIVLDEAHNAIGDSNIKNNIEKIISGKMVVYSSATYLKDMECINIYTPITDKIFKFSSTKDLIKIVSSSDENGSWFASEMVKNGNLIRREHSFDFNFNIIKVNKESAQNDSNKFAETIKKIFELHKLLKKKGFISYNESHWYQYGSLVSRLYRQYVLFIKLEDLINNIVSFNKENKKVVVVLENTYEALLNDIRCGNIDSDNNDDDIDSDLPEIESVQAMDVSFSRVMMIFLNKILLPYVVNGVVDSDVDNFISDLKGEISNNYNFDCSLIDVLLHKLKNLGISAGEISGRVLKYDINNKEITQRSKEEKDRITYVHNFNNGGLDVVVVTRAVSAGISLHASNECADRRERVMLEMEIINNPIKRLQVFGRIRRNGIVGDAYFYTLLSGLPYENRLFEYQNKKLLSMSGFSSAGQTKVNMQMELNTFKIYSARVYEYIYSWLSFNDYYMQYLGIKLDEYDDSNWSELIDKFLRRIFLLPNNQQENIFNIIDKISDLSDFDNDSLHIANYNILNNYGVVDCFSVNRINDSMFNGNEGLDNILTRFFEKTKLDKFKKLSQSASIIKDNISSFFKILSNYTESSRLLMTGINDELEVILIGVGSLDIEDVYNPSLYYFKLYDVRTSSVRIFWLTEILRYKIELKQNNKKMVINNNLTHISTYKIITGDNNKLLSIANLYNSKVKKYNFKDIGSILGVRLPFNEDIDGINVISSPKDLVAWIKGNLNVELYSNILVNKNITIFGDVSGVYFKISQDNEILKNFYISKSLGNYIKRVDSYNMYFVKYSLFYKMIYYMYDKANICFVSQKK